MLPTKTPGQLQIQNGVNLPGCLWLYCDATRGRLGVCLLDTIIDSYLRYSVVSFVIVFSRFDRFCCQDCIEDLLRIMKSVGNLISLIRIMASFQDLPRKASEIRAGELFGFKPSVLTCAILSIYSLFCVGCGSQESKIDEPSSSLSGSGLKTNRYTIKGVVRSIDRESHSVVIHHEAVPNFMPEMTMPFKVSGEILDDLEPGDEVQGTLEVGAEQSRLTDLFITRPAEAPVSPSSHSPSTNILSVG